MGVSGSSPNDPVTDPALPECGLPGLLSGGTRGEDGSGTCWSLSPPFPYSGISPCALPSGTRIGLTLPNPGPLTSRVQAAGLPQSPGTRVSTGCGAAPSFYFAYPAVELASAFVRPSHCLDGLEAPAHPTSVPPTSWGRAAARLPR